jgi:hypothetical protein
MRLGPIRSLFGEVPVMATVLLFVEPAPVVVAPAPHAWWGWHEGGHRP